MKRGEMLDKIIKARKMKLRLKYKTGKAVSTANAKIALHSNNKVA